MTIEKRVNFGIRYLCILYPVLIIGILVTSPPINAYLVTLATLSTFPVMAYLHYRCIADFDFLLKKKHPKLYLDNSTTTLAGTRLQGLSIFHLSEDLKRLHDADMVKINKHVLKSFYLTLISFLSLIFLSFILYI